MNNILTFIFSVISGILSLMLIPYNTILHATLKKLHHKMVMKDNPVQQGYIVISSGHDKKAMLEFACGLFLSPTIYFDEIYNNLFNNYYSICSPIPLQYIYIFLQFSLLILIKSLMNTSCLSFLLPSKATNLFICHHNIYFLLFCNIFLQTTAKQE